MFLGYPNFHARLRKPIGWQRLFVEQAMAIPEKYNKKARS
jgi:hypothetical protein